MFNLYNDATNAYSGMLFRDIKAIKYLHSRGVSEESIIGFKLGFSSEPYFLYNYLRNKYSKEQLENSKLFKDERDRYYNYIVTPLLSGEDVCSFTSRCLENKEPRHLHLNGGFDIPYNFNALKRSGVLYIVESPIDAIIMEQSGFNAIAVFGTNGLKDNHIEFLQDVNFDKIVFLFDNDVNLAGLNGSLGCALKCKNNNVDTFIGVLPKVLHTTKLDINMLYLYNKINFKNEINKLTDEAIPYLKTKHYKNYLESREEQEKKLELKIKIKEENIKFFQYLKETSVTKLMATILEVELFNFGGKSFCPFHADKNSKSLVFYDNSGMICCFGCGFKGDFIGFIQKYYNLSFLEALKRIKEILCYKD
jgi:DNA primase